MIQAIKVPEIGESVESGVVVVVHIKTGDQVTIDDTIIELETDKALVEIPSPYSGRVTEVRVEAGAKVKVGDIIARVETETAPVDQKVTGEGTNPERPAGEVGENTRNRQTPLSPATPHPETPSIDTQKLAKRPPAPASPSIRRLARELGVDIYAVNGSGSGGRVTEDDIKSHIRKKQSSGSGMVAASAGPPSLPDFSRWGAIDIEEMDTVRSLTAQSTASSWAIVPHVTQFDEADITGITEFIDAHARKAANQGAKLTITAVVTKVCAQALKRFPRFNASIDTDAKRIIFKHYVHIGIATDTPRGLLVPVIRDADRKSIVQLAKNIADLAERARSKKIKQDELEGGTFSISNQGGIGGVAFTPIVLWPQAAILGISRSAVKPVYIQDRFEPRTLLPISLSYDHRIIDGADAARFLRWICESLESPMNLFLD